VSDTPTLTLERLFASPGLSGPLPSQARYSPDGRRIAWLRPAEDDAERLDLWLRELDQAQNRCLVDARDLDSGRILSEEEKARRERLRIFAGGIVEFHWMADGRRLVFPIGGVLYRLDVLDPTAVPRALTDLELFVTDVQCAPAGDLVAFVHDRDLWIIEGDGPARRLTQEGGGTRSMGLADFIAAEEMHRYAGYFFSPDGRRIAVLHTDEAPIPLSHRYEISGDGFSVHAQHYPYTGGPNAAVRLAVLDLDTDTLSWLDWGEGQYEYLARVAWRTDGRGLLLQRQPRDQRTLELVELSLDGSTRVLWREESPTWVNLGDDLRPLKNGHSVLWGTERDGPRRLHRIDLTTGASHPLSPSSGSILELVAVDESRGRVFVEANFDHPTQRHLYELPLDGGAPRRLTRDPGCHRTQLAPDFRSFLDRREGLDQPPCLDLRPLDGGEAIALVANDPGDPGHPYHPFLPGRAHAELGELTAADGQRLCFRLTRPPGADATHPCPMILAVYGGPGVQRVQDAWTPLIHQYFVQRGWGVFELDNRGSSGRGRDFEAPIHRRLGQVEVEDQLIGMDYLRQLPWVDDARIAVFGHSYGGYMALMCLAQHPDRFRAAVSVAPVTDWMLYDTHYTERYLDHPDGNRAGYEASSVFAHLDGLAAAPDGALLLMHGMADDNVLFTHTTRLMDALQMRGIRFELMTYPGAKHGLAGPQVSLHRFRVIETHLTRAFEEHRS
jgi:dipeptidyl-peptidase-4